MTDTPETKPFEPVIIGFTCNWCSYRAADMAGTARMKYAPNVRLIRLMCSGRLDPTFVFKAFAGGADAVLVSGCHPGDCHYINQNYKAMRRFHLMQRVLAQIGHRTWTPEIALGQRRRRRHLCPGNNQVHRRGAGTWTLELEYEPWTTDRGQ